MCLNVPGYTLDYILHSKGKNIHILDLSYDEVMRSQLLRRSKTEKLDDSIMYFKHLIHAILILCYFTAKYN